MNLEISITTQKGFPSKNLHFIMYIKLGTLIKLGFFVKVEDGREDTKSTRKSWGSEGGYLALKDPWIKSPRFKGPIESLEMVGWIGEGEWDGERKVKGELRAGSGRAMRTGLISKLSAIVCGTKVDATEQGAEPLIHQHWLTCHAIVFSKIGAKTYGTKT